MMASRKLKSKFESGNKKIRSYRNQEGPSGPRRSSKDNMDDMEKIIKELSNKISKMNWTNLRMIISLEKISEEILTLKCDKDKPTTKIKRFSPPLRMKNFYRRRGHAKL
jgi:hypothetical protein